MSLAGGGGGSHPNLHLHFGPSAAVAKSSLAGITVGRVYCIQDSHMECQVRSHLTKWLVEVDPSLKKNWPNAKNAFLGRHIKGTVSHFVGQNIPLQCFKEVFSMGSLLLQLHLAVPPGEQTRLFFRLWRDLRRTRPIFLLPSRAQRRELLDFKRPDWKEEEGENLGKEWLREILGLILLFWVG